MCADCQLSNSPPTNKMIANTIFSMSAKDVSYAMIGIDLRQLERVDYQWKLNTVAKVEDSVSLLWLLDFELFSASPFKMEFTSKCTNCVWK